MALGGKKWQEAEEACMMWSFINCTHHQIVLGMSNCGWYVRGMWYTWHKNAQRVLMRKTWEKKTTCKKPERKRPLARNLREKTTCKKKPERKRPLAKNLREKDHLQKTWEKKTTYKKPERKRPLAKNLREKDHLQKTWEKKITCKKKPERKRPLAKKNLREKDNLQKNLREKDHLQNLGVDGILKWVVKMQGSKFEYLEWQQQIKVTLIQELIKIKTVNFN